MGYNNKVMTEEQFIQEEEQFLQAIKESELYQKMKELSSAIDHDSALRSLAEKRNFLYEQAGYYTGEKREELLKEFKKTDDEFKANPIVKEYLENYRKLKRILNAVSDSFMKELRKI